MVVAVVVEVLVGRLERAPVVRVLAGLVRVLPEQNPVLILDEEGARGPRLAAQLGEDGAGFGVDVRHPVEHGRQPRQIVGVEPEVRGDERRVPVLR